MQSTLWGEPETAAEAEAWQGIGTKVAHKPDCHVPDRLRISQQSAVRAYFLSLAPMQVRNLSYLALEQFLIGICCM